MDIFILFHSSSNISLRTIYTKKRIKVALVFQVFLVKMVILVEHHDLVYVLTTLGPMSERRKTRYVWQKILNSFEWI